MCKWTKIRRYHRHDTPRFEDSVCVWPPFVPAWLLHHHSMLCLRCPLHFADLGLSSKRTLLILQTLDFCHSWWNQCSYSVTVCFFVLFFWVFLGSTEPPPPSHPAPYGWSDCQIFYSRLPLPWQPCTQLRETCLNQHAASDEAPAQRNCEACLMTGLKTLFLDTSGLTFHCHPWNLPKGPMLSLATDVSPMTLEYSFSLLSRAPNTLPQSVTPPSTCYSAKRHTHLVDAQFSFSLSMVGTNVFLLGRQSSFCRQTSACLPSVIGWVTAHIPFLPFQSWKRVTLFCK